MSNWTPALLFMELDNLLWQGVNHLEIKQLWECCYLPRLASYDVLEEAITSGLNETEFFAYAAAVGENRYISLKLGERVRPEKSGYLVKVKAAKTQMERVAQEEEERQRAEHERQQGKIGGSGTAGAGTAGVTGTTPDGTNTGGQTGGGGNAGGTQPEPEIITPPPAPKSMSFYLSTQLDTTRVNRDVQKILEEVVSVLTQENGVTVELRFDVQATAPKDLQPSTIRAVSENCRTLKITNFGFVEE